MCSLHFVLEVRNTGILAGFMGPVGFPWEKDDISGLERNGNVTVLDQIRIWGIFMARRYASTIYAVVV